MQGDSEAEGLLKRFREKSREIEAKASQGKPVEVRRKARSRRFGKKVASNDKIKEMIRCEADYLDLMRRKSTMRSIERRRKRMPIFPRNKSAGRVVIRRMC